jgi:hypothetical protein
MSQVQTINELTEMLVLSSLCKARINRPGNLKVKIKRTMSTGCRMKSRYKESKLQHKWRNRLLWHLIRGLLPNGIIYTMVSRQTSDVTRPKSWSSIRPSTRFPMFTVLHPSRNLNPLLDFSFQFAQKRVYWGYWKVFCWVIHCLGGYCFGYCNLLIYLWTERNIVNPAA